MKTKVILSQQMASAIIAAGQEEAQKNNWSVSIAVADDGGHLLALSRMDDCAPIAAYISSFSLISPTPQLPLSRPAHPVLRLNQKRPRHQ